MACCENNAYYVNVLTCGKEFTMKKLLDNTLFGNKRFMLEEMTYSEFYFANSTLGFSYSKNMELFIHLVGSFHQT